MRKIIAFFIATLTVIVLAACGDESNDSKTNDTTNNNSDKLAVYTTVYPLKYFTERIGEDAVDVKSIYPTGANEHSFEPTQKDMIALADSDVFFYIGLGLEGFVENAKKTLVNENVQLVPTADHLSEEQLDVSTGHTHAEAVEETGHDHDHEGEESHDHDDEATEEHTDGHDHAGHEHDSHVWLSPVLSKELALTIKNTLTEKLPEQADTFEANYNELVAELDTLHAEFEALASETTKDTFFVSHAAFGYIAGHYGFTQVPIAGLNSQSEPSQKELASIVDLAKDRNIEYIFFEQNVNSKLAEVIQKEVGAKSLILHNLSVLTADDEKNNETYFTLMEKNIEALRTALK